MTRIAKDIIAGKDFIVNVFDANKQDIKDNTKLYEAFESGWPVVIKNLTIPQLKFRIFSRILKLINDVKGIIVISKQSYAYCWTSKLNLFHKKHKQTMMANYVVPRYKTWTICYDGTTH